MHWYNFFSLIPICIPFNVIAIAAKNIKLKIAFTVVAFAAVAFQIFSLVILLKDI